MTTLSAFLDKSTCTQETRTILEHLAGTGIAIRSEIHIDATKKDQEKNTTGDTQSALDLTTDEIVRDALEKTNCVVTAASEEKDKCYHFNAENGNYFVAYDPYDGGSVGDANISFGSIFGIWSKDPLNSIVGKNLIAACYLIYGPRVTFVMSIKGSGVHLFELDNDNIFHLVSKDLMIKEKAQHFAPGNLRVSLSDLRYRAVIERWLRDTYTLRYTGAFVSDVNHILLKGDGIFVYPREKKYPTGRLRLLYECAPLSLIAHEACGHGSTQHGTNLLDEMLSDYHQRTTIVIGSSLEVATVINELE